MYLGVGLALGQGTSVHLHMASHPPTDWASAQQGVSGSQGSNSWSCKAS